MKNPSKAQDSRNKKITLELNNGLIHILFSNTAEAGKKQNNQPKKGH